MPSKTTAIGFNAREKSMRIDCDNDDAPSAPDQGISAEQAQAIVLASFTSEPWAVESCRLSACGEYWVIGSNSAAYVLHGQAEHLHFGVNAQLVHTISGAREIVDSGMEVEDYLSDKRDGLAAGDRYYVLEPDFERTDKSLLIRLRQKLECSLQMAMQMLSEPNRRWLTGTRRALMDAQALLAREGVPTTVVLRDDVGPAVALRIACFWPQVQEALRRMEPRLEK